jgi:ATP-binding cassette subfamily F protein 3
LEEFIAKNKARAATATLARSKAKQLERLELTEIAGDEPTARIRAPRVEPRKGPALRCRDLAIGYPERQIASDIHLEIEHGSRAAVVGDNGQGKTTFLRTVVDSLKPLAGEVRWGHGCKIGVYAQHVYTSLPEKQTVLGYLEQQAAFGKKDQEILEVAGALLFRKAHVKKPISILSGGERARLCLAALLLSEYNVLILDEPANHLDVDTVDALVEALLEYQGTVIFTSHDRHLTKRVATCIVEVRDSRVTSFSGNYDAYVYKVNKEIEVGERELANQRTKLVPAMAKPAKASSRPPQRDERRLRKEIKTVEQTIARLDEQKGTLNAQLQQSTDAIEALRLHNEIEAATAQLADAEERWCRLQEMIEGNAV